MLTELIVEQLGVIERAELTLEPGCSVLTGETGAGKTLVVAALGLLLGGRADRGLVREGAGEARVEGRFALPPGHPAGALLADRGLLEPEDPERGADVVVSRTVGAEGRGKARVNGRLTPVAALSELAEQLVEIAGQNEHLRIATPAAQRDLLDAFAGEEARTLAGEVSEAVRARVRAEREAQRLAEQERARSRELDVLRFEIAEIEGAGLSTGEADLLHREIGRLEHAESIALGLARAVEALRGEGGAEERLSEAASEAVALSGKDPRLEAPGRRLEAAAIEIADVAQELVACGVEPDPQALESARERLAVVSRLLRKYGDDESEVLAYLERARARLEELVQTSSDIERLRSEQDAHAARAGAAARRLSTLRREGAELLEREMTALLADLAMPQARFEVALHDRSLYEGGLEAVELRVAANPGETPRPLGKVASGGELSRIALALHLLTAAHAADTLVFDEVDSGVGGQAAQSVGRCLARLATRTSGQVLVVTHLPQVAAFADAHYRVAKIPGSRRASARVERVVGEERVSELSRMLAGLPRSERAREHAQELLDMAVGAR